MLKRDKVHSKCTAWSSGVYFWFAQGKTVLLERTRTAWAGAGAGEGAGTGAGTLSRSSSVTVYRQAPKFKTRTALYCNSQGWLYKEQQADGAGPDLPASSGHRTLGFVVSALCCLAGVSAKAEFHAVAHHQASLAAPCRQWLYVERLWWDINF